MAEKTIEEMAYQYNHYAFYEYAMPSSDYLQFQIPIQQVQQQYFQPQDQGEQGWETAFDRFLNSSVKQPQQQNFQQQDESEQDWEIAFEGFLNTVNTKFENIENTLDEIIHHNNNLELCLESLLSATPDINSHVHCNAVTLKGEDTLNINQVQGEDEAEHKEQVEQVEAENKQTGDDKQIEQGEILAPAEKLINSGSFSIPCIIKKFNYKILCESDASVKPLFLYSIIEPKEIKPSTAVIQPFTLLTNAEYAEFQFPKDHEQNRVFDKGKWELKFLQNPSIIRKWNIAKSSMEFPHEALERGPLLA